jgi:hypothetical protein
MKTMLALGVMLLGAGCISDQMTLRPLFTEKEAVREPALAGTWMSDDRDPLVLVIRPIDQGYELRAIEKGVASRPLALGLGRIGGELYWDATAGPCEEQDDLREQHLVPVHSLARIELGADRLVIAPLRSTWVKAALADGTLDTPFLLVDDEPLLTGSTAELQQLIREHADDEGAFPQDPETSASGTEALVLRRVAADASADPVAAATPAAPARR